MSFTSGNKILKFLKNYTFHFLLCRNDSIYFLFFDFIFFSKLHKHYCNRVVKEVELSESIPKSFHDKIPIKIGDKKADEKVTGRLNRRGVTMNVAFVICRK